jgi:hypothetical protein
MTDQNSQAECCPKFDPSTWDGKTVEWTDKLFIRKDLPQFLHIPLPGMIGSMITKTWKQIETAGAKPETKDFIWLCYDPSPWRCENYLSVTKEVPGVQNVKLSGTFMTKVFEGPYQNVPTWIKEMETYVKGQGKSVKKFFFYYTTCPKCAKKWGKNYVVIFAQV